MAAPLITAITTVPNRENATNQASFSNDVDTFFSEVDGFQTQANAQAQYLDGVAAEVDASEAAAAASALEASGYASTAIDARDAAISSSVYKGTWEGKTSAGVLGESYSYQGSYIYRLNVNLANLSTSEPSPTNTDWQLINVVPFEAPCKPTLDLDFANQDFTIYDKLGGFVKRPLADLVSQGRSTAGSSVDAIGGITEFAAGENRFTFDGETGEALGYLSEESRTNLLTNSEFPNGLSDAPSKSTLNLTLSSIDIGNGTINALAFGYDGVNDAFAYKTNFSTVVGVTYTLSAFVEMDDGGAPVFLSATASSPENDFFLVTSNSDAFNENPLKYKTTRHYGNVYRVSVDTTTKEVSFLAGVIKFATNSPRTFKVTGYQLEVGSFPTSYIKTLGTAVTRAADTMTRTLGQEWNPNEGTFVIKARSGSSKLPEPILFTLFKDSNNLVYLSRSTTGENFILVSILAGSAGSISGILDASSIFVISIKSNFLSIATDTGFYSELNISTPVTVVDTVALGAYLSHSYEMNGTMKRVMYYPRSFDSLTSQRLARIQ